MARGFAHKIKIALAIKHIKTLTNMKISSLAFFLMSTTAVQNLPCALAGRDAPLSFVKHSSIRGIKPRVLQGGDEPTPDEPSIEEELSVESMDSEEEKGRVNLPTARECETGKFG